MSIRQTLFYTKKSGRTAFLPASIAVQDFKTQPAGAQATMLIRAVGTYQSTPAGYSGTWLTGGGTGADYEIRYSLTSGSVSAGSDATGTWLSLSSNRTWLVTKSGATVGTNESIGTLEIRDASTGAIAASCPMQLTADVS